MVNIFVFWFDNIRLMVCLDFKDKLEVVVYKDLVWDKVIKYYIDVILWSEYLFKFYR